MFLGEDVDLKDDLEDLSDPVGEEDDNKADHSTSDLSFAGFLGVFVGGTSQHGEASHDEHTK